MNYLSIEFLKKIKMHIYMGGIIAYPTEYCYGLGCNPFDYKAVQKIIKLKRRSNAKGLIVIASKISQLDNLVRPFNDKEINELIKYWPGHYTFLVEAKDNLFAKNIIGRNTEIAVRITQHPLVKILCDWLNMPLISTSANISGHYPLLNFKECFKVFNNEILIIPGNTLNLKKPSTIIQLKNKKILR